VRSDINCAIEVDHPVMIGGADGEFIVDLSPDLPAYVTTDGVPVWLERKKIKTRFLDADGNQVGPWHGNFVPAIVYAHREGWWDPSSPDWFNEACIREVREGGVPPQAGQPDTRKPSPLAGEPITATEAQRRTTFELKRDRLHAQVEALDALLVIDGQEFVDPAKASPELIGALADLYQYGWAHGLIEMVARP
jgi:hypothetical protein